LETQKAADWRIPVRSVVSGEERGSGGRGLMEETRKENKVREWEWEMIDIVRR